VVWLRAGSVDGDDLGMEKTLRRCSATLGCGVVLTYEAPSFLPCVGDVVPCHRHGYCSVISRGGALHRVTQKSGRMPPRRSQAELLAFLTHRPDTSVSVLRKNRFTLRTVMAAQRDGLVDADLVTGRVALRSAVAGCESEYCNCQVHADHQ
jgi:hypothetical protein